MDDQLVSKQNSLVIKGIAVFLLLFHHLFYFAGNYADFEIVFLFGQQITVSLALYSRVCLALFIFVTAYGLSIKYNNGCSSVADQTRQIKKSYLKTLRSFLLVFILAFAVCQISGLRTYSEVYGGGFGSLLFLFLDATFLADFFRTPTLNVTWWYMTVYLLLLLTLPFLWRMSRSAGILLLPALFIVFRIFALTDNGYTTYLLCAALGCILADQRYAVLLKEFFAKHSVIGLPLILLTLLASLVLLLKHYIASEMIVVYLLACIAFVLLAVFYIARIKPLAVVLAFIGRYSMNIFLIHTFFYYYLCTAFIYSFRYDFLILLALLICSLAASLIIELIKKGLAIGFANLRKAIAR